MNSQGEDMKELTTKTDVKHRHGDTDKDLALLEPVKQYYSQRKNRDITLYSRATIEEHLQVRYGSPEKCKRLAEARCAIARAATKERLLGPPPGWPVVGNLKGATRWAAIDTETSGLDPANGCRCVEIAVIVVEDGRVITEWSTRINPGPSTTWEQGAIECNGISPEHLADAPTPAEAWGIFVSLTDGLPLVAHNASFDRKFIAAELTLVGMQSYNWTWHCTMGSKRRQLGSLYYDYARRWINSSHSALADAKTVAYLAPRVC
jgi:DNA polymerase III subunit epsilon